MLYNQYVDARNRYHYYRDRLLKEMSTRPASGLQGAPGGVATASIPPPMMSGGLAGGANTMLQAAGSMPGLQQLQQTASLQGVYAAQQGATTAAPQYTFPLSYTYLPSAKFTKETML